MSQGFEHVLSLNCCKNLDNNVYKTFTTHTVHLYVTWEVMVKQYGECTTKTYLHVYHAQVILHKLHCILFFSYSTLGINIGQNMTLFTIIGCTFSVWLEKHSNQSKKILSVYYWYF